MASSIGAAVAQGIESGFALGQRGLAMRQAEEERLQRERDLEQQRADQREERAYQRTRQRAQDKRLEQQDERQRRLDELKLLDSEMTDLQAEGQGLFSQFGGYDKVPEDVRTDYTGRVRALRGRRSQLRQSFYSQGVVEQQKQAAELWSRVQAGQMSLEDLADDDLLRTLVVQTRRPLSDFTRTDPTKPAPVEQAVLDVEAGLETGNRDLLVKGANVLLRPELTAGIGTEGPDGNEIVDKRLYDLVPHPQQPGLFVPILEVTVRRDDGAIGTYRAPVTEGRGVYATDPTAMPKAISVQDAIDRVGQLGALSQFVNDPKVRSRLDRASPAARASADEFLQALGAVGVAAPKPSKITRERVDLGSHIVEREVDESGRIISEKKLAKGLAPSRSHGGGPTAAERDDARRDRELKAAVERGEITPEEARDARRRRILGTKPAVEDKPLTESQAKANLFGKRMQAAEEVIARIGADYSPMAINAKAAAEDLPLIGGLAGMAGNAMLSDNDQAIEQAQRDFINAVLRRESGAVISESEFRNARRQYFPQPGDSETTIKQKAANRAQAIEGMFDELPPGRRQQAQQGRGLGVTGAWESPGAKQPPATNAKGWRLMTDARGNMAYVSPDGRQFEEVR